MQSENSTILKHLIKISGDLGILKGEFLLARETDKVLHDKQEQLIETALQVSSKMNGLFLKVQEDIRKSNELGLRNDIEINEIKKNIKADSGFTSEYAKTKLNEDISKAGIRKGFIEKLLTWATMIFLLAYDFIRQHYGLK